MRIGVLIIFTGKYDCFYPQLVAGINKYFLPNHERTIYAFSDKGIGFNVPTYRFPLPTLLRYHWFTQYANAIEGDVLYYIDVDMKVVAEVGDEILPDETGLVATRHPGFWNGGWGDYGTDKSSLAYVPIRDRKGYYAGGFQGGTRDVYLTAAAEMAQSIEIDKRRRVRAHQNDESHWNKYLVSHPFKEISPSYCFPEAAWAKDLPFEKRIIALDKNHEQIRTI